MARCHQALPLRLMHITQPPLSRWLLATWVATASSVASVLQLPATEHSLACKGAVHSPPCPNCRLYPAQACPAQAALFSCGHIPSLGRLSRCPGRGTVPPRPAPSSGTSW